MYGVLRKVIFKVISPLERVVRQNWRRSTICLVLQMGPRANGQQVMLNILNVKYLKIANKSPLFLTEARCFSTTRMNKLLLHEILFRGSLEMLPYINDYNIASFNC